VSKKIITIFLLVLVLIFIFIKFNKLVISNYILSNLSKWTEKTVIADSIDVDYAKRLIIFNDLEILNEPGFYSKNIFEVKKLTIKIELSSVFSDLVQINKFTLHEPKFFFEIKDMSDKVERSKETTKDNIGLVEKINEQVPPKKYPPKKKDKNFLISNISINNSKAFIRYPNSPETLIVKLSNMSFRNTGNANPKKNKKFQHYKDVLRLIMGDIYFRIPDMKLRKFLKKKYRIE